MAQFFDAIAFNKGIVICKQYHEKLTGETICRIYLRKHFKNT